MALEPLVAFAPINTDSWGGETATTSPGAVNPYHPQDEIDSFPWTAHHPLPHQHSAMRDTGGDDTSFGNAPPHHYPHDEEGCGRHNTSPVPHSTSPVRHNTTPVGHANSFVGHGTRALQWSYV